MILVSGFKPFLNEKINPSELLVEKLKVNYKDLKAVVLPVEFDRAYLELQKTIEAVRPKFVIMFGQAGGRPNVCLEKIALNWNQTKSADESKHIPQTGRIGDGELALMSTFAVDDLSVFLADRRLKTEISFSAGAFVCNNLYFKVLKNNPLIQSIFVHVPFLPEQGLPSHPKMDFELMYETASQIVQFAKSRT
ncbi:MAG: pyroglutamyl-peptidase I [Bdellovibrionota bacterium]